MRGIVWSLALIAGLLVGANFYYGSMNGGGMTPAADEPADDVMMPDPMTEPTPEPMPEPPMSEPPMSEPMADPMPPDPMTDEPPVDVDEPVVEPDLGDMVPNDGDPAAGETTDPDMDAGITGDDNGVTVETPPADDIGALIMEDAAEAVSENAETGTSTPNE